jgi:DNA polymerase-3 subunit delta
LSTNEAASRAGIPPFARNGIELQLRHFGRRRLDRLYDWLLQIDMGFKGSSQLTPRVLLEQLVVRLGRAAETVRVRSN